jgi:hypothetical protein
MRFVLRIVGLAGYVHVADEATAIGQWVKSFDADAFDGRGDLVTTSRRDEALQFSCPGAAILLWRSRSRVRPLREDGMPNRPLTAFNVEIEPS